MINCYSCKLTENELGKQKYYYNEYQSSHYKKILDLCVLQKREIRSDADTIVPQNQPSCAVKMQPQTVRVITHQIRSDLYVFQYAIALEV